MAAVAVLTASIDPTKHGAILTFIAPAVDGCGMNCAYCFISQRDERVEAHTLSPNAYAAFIRGAAATRRIAAVTLQGYEPLAPASLTWTEAVLRAGREVGAETGLVTNGLYLFERLAWLNEQSCGGVTVSIDAASAEQHDRMRKCPGAWDTAMHGLASAVKMLPEAVLVVNSVLFPGHSARLRDLPRELAKIGIRKWSVSPMLRFKKDGAAVVHGNVTQLRRDLALLSKAAAAVGVEMHAEDEFSLIGNPKCVSGERHEYLPDITVRTLSRPEGLLRLTPDGRCAFGLEVLRESYNADCTWRSGQDVTEFLSGRLEQHKNLEFV